MTSQEFRPVAVPLIAVDPYFSVWSFGDRLTDDVTRHWTGRRQAMTGILRVDGSPYQFLGTVTATDREYCYVPKLPQVGCRVGATMTVCTFENDILRMELSFYTPAFADRPALLSRPASYIRYEITVKDGKEHDIEVYFDVAMEMTTERESQNFKVQRTSYSLCVGNAEQHPLNRSGDDLRIDWGYLHLCKTDAFVTDGDWRRHYAQTGKLRKYDEDAIFTYGSRATLAYVSRALCDTIVLAYDDVHSVNYFGELLDGYYLTEYKTFDCAAQAAIREADEMYRACLAFDRELWDAMLPYSEDFALTGSLLYRQAIAAHKAVADRDGQLLFLSKECFSNGCMATLDVTYPSIPLFLLFAPELVRGMIRPIAKMARQSNWTYDFAPHDIGQYPLGTGQVYGYADGKFRDEEQMPVEECGNFILTVAAICRAEGSDAFARENDDLMQKYAAYLAENGYDPGNQLCTDDFAGHLAHNCNLSLKAIVALAAYGRLMGEGSYYRLAKEMAERFVQDAENGRATRLTFDRPDSWSMKYNAVWDRLLDLSLFPASFYRREVELYQEKFDRYGVPLDCRAEYTKLDWLAWTTVLTDDRAYSDRVFAAIAQMICDTPERVPVTDWYDAKTGRMCGFCHRSVVGGYFIPMLLDRFRG